MQWLDLFIPAHRGKIANYFYAQIRAGYTSPAVICSRVLQEVESILKHRGESGVSKANILAMMRAHPADCMAFAAECVRRESLPHEEREKQRDEGAKAGKRASMEGQPATEKQIAYLKKLGYDGEVENRLQASDLIEARRGE